MTTGYEYDDGKTMVVDDTTSATYTYIYKSLNTSPVATKQEWLCKRVTNATGTASYGNGVSDFLKPEKLLTIASGLTATYY